MKRLALVAILAFSGCASPAEDYVRAEAGAWAQLDEPYDASGKPRLDAWIDGDSALSPEKKDALHQLNAGRRARVSHALSEFQK